jgi:uncharacterized protein
MKIAIISDLHDNLTNLNKVLKISQVENVKKLICAGDLGNKETLKYLATNFKNKIYLVYGNADLYPQSETEKYSNIIFFDSFGFFKIAEIKFALCHEPYFIKKILETKKKIDYLFYGHTHRPNIEIKNKIILANPGSLNDSMQLSSLAILNTITKKLKLKLC